jgi:hypothetical protein
MSLILALVFAAQAQDFGYVAIMAQAREALIAKDYKTARTLLTAADAAAPTSSSPLAEADLARLPFYRGLVEWRSGDKDKAALDWWRRVLVLSPQFEPDPELLPEADAQDVLYALRGEVRSYAQSPTGLPEEAEDLLVFIDGKRLGSEEMLTVGRHLVQVRCGESGFEGAWYEYGQPPVDFLALCNGGTLVSTAMANDPKAVAKAAAAKAAADRKAAADKAAADKAAAAQAKIAEKEAAKAAVVAKAAADKAAAEKAAADKAAAEKAAADKVAADKAVADKAAADKVAADKAVADKAAADKVAADKTVPDKTVPDKAVADKVAADKVAADKAVADKAAADKAVAGKVAADKAAADKVAAEKAVADKAAADKAVADKAAADKVAAAVKSSTTVTPKGTVDVPALVCLAAGGGLLAAGAVVNFTVVEPAYAAIEGANAAPGTMAPDVASAWEGRFTVGSQGTIGLIGGGLALLGTGVVLQILDTPVTVMPNGIAISGSW